MKSKIIAVSFWLGYALIVMALLPSLAQAWGPGAHIECSDFLLRNLVLLAPVVRKLLRDHPFEFIYGSVCPDMVLGKRYMRPERNNHNWEVSLKLLQSARNPRQRSFAMGYLSHLAADTIAHNQFIPDQIIRQYNRRRRSHMMQELIFDAHLGDGVWKLAREVARMPFPDCERLMHRALPRTPLPKKVNLKIFRSGVLLVRFGGWQRIIRRLRRRWHRENDAATLSPYLDAIHQTVIAALNDPYSSPCRRHSPTGGAVLPAAVSLRRTLQQLHKESPLSPEHYSSLVSAFTAWRDQELFIA